MRSSRWLILTAALVRAGLPANLAISTYFKDGFTPAAISSDAQGNVYVAGNTVIDPTSPATGVAVAKFDPKASQYLYLAYLDSTAGDQVASIAIDGAGDAYVAGWTTNANFPVVGGGSLGTAPNGASDKRSFVTKLNPQGAVVFSALIGGSVVSTAQGIAVTPQGQILVSGIAGASGFPTTAGAYSVADSNAHWFLMELDATASKMIFSATGIGGSSIALDAAGNIYLAGSNTGTDYPTTPGAYQTTFVQGYYCFTLCQIGFPGGLQHVTKTDSKGSTLIYSTGLNAAQGGAGSTTNTGLAVDAAGNAYVTGTLFQALYPFTVTTTANSYTGYLSKLDPAGANLLFSIPVGGAGVQLDSSGAVYAGGVVASPTTFPVPTTTPTTPPAIFSWIPQMCLPNNITGLSEAYVLKVDPSSGAVQDGQWIDGSAAGATAIALAGGKVWITGPTAGPDVPFTPGVLAPGRLGPGFLGGAYLAAADFSSSANGKPVIACVLDAGNLTHVGATTAFQLITVLGENLGPATGVAASGGPSTSIAGVSVTFDGNNPAQLLYVSSSQINLAVPAPLPSRAVVPLPSATVMQITVNGANVQRQFPYTVSNLSVFADLSATAAHCGGVGDLTTGTGFQPLASNADGSLNSCTNPAKFASTVSFYLHGIGAIQLGFPPASQLSNLQVSVGTCSAAVTNAQLIDGFVYKVDVTMPASTIPCAQYFGPVTPAELELPVAFSYNGLPVGPFVVPAPGSLPNMFSPGVPMGMVVWVTQ